MGEKETYDDFKQRISNSVSDDDEENTEFERGYDDGGRAAWRAVLWECVRNLGYCEEDLTNERAILQLELAKAALRSACEEFGDNDWADDLSLASVIEKHLLCHIRDRDRDNDWERS